MSKIGHAAKDERGKYSGGTAGDQTRQEVYTRTWYNRPWSHILRATDPTVRERLATAMDHACDNDLIGYDQGQRNTLLTQVRSKGYDPGKATVACECDCSSLVSVCCMYAGIKEGALYIGGNCATTATLRKRLMDTGAFDLYIGNRYLASPDYLLRGDILLYEGHHVAVCLEDGKGAVPSYPTPTRTLRKGCTGVDVKWLQQRLNAEGAGLAVDGDFGDCTKAAVVEYQFKHGLEPDGIVGPATRAKLVA